MEGMCGRFVATTDPALLAEKITAIDEVGAKAPRYNVAPTDPIVAIVSRRGEPDDEPTRRMRLMRWGLLPGWTTVASGKGPLLINARADTVVGSPAFRHSAKSRRCLIPMDGWYEWRANPDAALGKTTAKTPFFMHRTDGAPLFAAGLWSVCKPAEEPLLSCAIITTDAVGELAGIHHRMPLLLNEDDWDAWLNPDAPVDPDLLARPPQVHGVELRQVSTLVNSVRNNGPELLEPADPGPEQMTLL